MTGCHTCIYLCLVLGCTVYRKVLCETSKTGQGQDSDNRQVEIVILICFVQHKSHHLLHPYLALPSVDHFHRAPAFGLNVLNQSQCLTALHTPGLHGINFSSKTHTNVYVFLSSYCWLICIMYNYVYMPTAPLHYTLFCKNFHFLGILTSPSIVLYQTGAWLYVYTSSSTWSSAVDTKGIRWTVNAKRFRMWHYHVYILSVYTLTATQWRFITEMAALYATPFGLNQQHLYLSADCGLTTTLTPDVYRNYH